MLPGLAVVGMVVEDTALCSGKEVVWGGSSDGSHGSP